MIAHEITHPAGDSVFMVVGEVNHLVLAGRYDQDQYWLPLGSVFLFVAEAAQPPRDIEKEHRLSMPRVTKRKGKPFASNSNAVFRGFDAEQTEIPFQGHNRVTHKQWEKLVAARLPGWERTKNGNLIFVQPKTDRFWNEAEVLLWLRENADYWYYIINGVVHFYSGVDAVNFKLVWT